MVQAPTTIQQQSNQNHHVQQGQTIVQTVTHQQKPKSHFCGHCGKGFAAKHGLLLHNKRHPNGGCTMRSHVCECGKAFFQKNHLMLHQRQHMEQKPTAIQVRKAIYIDFFWSHYNLFFHIFSFRDHKAK